MGLILYETLNSWDPEFYKPIIKDMAFKWLI